FTFFLCNLYISFIYLFTFFFFNLKLSNKIFFFSLHDALPILFVGLDVIGGYVTEINVTSPTGVRELDKQFGTKIAGLLMDAIDKDRKSTRLNSSHVKNSYAVFCLKKKNQTNTIDKYTSKQGIS